MLLLAITSIEAQYLLIGVLFLAAAFYVGRIFWRAFLAKRLPAAPKAAAGPVAKLISTPCNAPSKRGP